jgi:hypothetical protein
LSLVAFSSHCAHASYGGKIPIMMRAWQEVDEVAVLAGGMHRSLVLVMDRDVAGHHIAKGFDRSLLPRIRKAQAGNKKGNGKDAVSGSNT